MNDVAYVPARGDAIWLDFAARVGHEQAGRRPALVLSPAAYHRATGLALMCPITSRVKGYPFEVALPDDGELRGVVLSDHVKNLDWEARQARFAARMPAGVVTEVAEKLRLLLP